MSTDTQRLDPMPTSGTHLDMLTRAVLQSSDDADSLMNELSHDQLLWRPSANRWSVAEWFEYLVSMGEDYQARIREPMLAAWHDPNFEDAPYRRTIVGGWSVMAARVRARHSGGRGEIVPPAATSNSPARFLAQQSEVLDLLDEARDVDLRNVRLRSPLARLVGPCLGDALELLVVRQQYGVMRASDVAEAAGFPGGSRVARHTPAGVLQSA